MVRLPAVSPSCRCKVFLVLNLHQGRITEWDVFIMNLYSFFFFLGYFHSILWRVFSFWLRSDRCKSDLSCLSF